MRRAIFFVALVACGGPDFEAKYASDYAKAGAVSVLGIVRDGRLAPEIWDDVHVKLLPGRACEPGYSADFVTKNGEVSSAIDDTVRANGPSDELLAEIAPLAKGDAILLISIAGRPPEKTETPVATAPRPTMGRMGGTRGSRYEPRTQTDHNVFEISATLFSIARRRSVAELTMKYSGHDVDEAMAKFAERLSSDIPIASCAGWIADAHALDPDKIRQLGR